MDENFIKTLPIYLQKDINNLIEELKKHHLILFIAL